MYRLPKTHKQGIPLRSVISSIGSHNYRLAKVLAARLEPSRHSQYILCDLFDFVRSIRKLDAGMLKRQMIAFDVTSLLTKVPIAYTINLILDRLYGQSDNCFDNENEKKKIKKRKQENWCSSCQKLQDLKQLLEIATSDTHFTFNGKYYKQHNGVAMDSPLAPIIADIFITDLV